MILSAWTARYNIPQEALTALVSLLNPINPVNTDGLSEAANQTALRVEASKAGWRLWRNNVGAAYTSDGSFIRYGLANDSQQLNKRLKSSDLIGLKPVLITPEMVGHIVGQFVAREVKRGGWKYTGTAREVAQLNYLTLVASLGGDARFTTGVL